MLEEKNVKFGKVLRELRKNKRMNQTELSRLLEISQCTVSSYERGYGVFSVELIKKINEVFGVNVEKIVQSTIPKEVLLKDANLEQIIKRLHAMNIQPTFVFLKK